MQNSTIPYHVLVLTPNRFLRMIHEKKVRLVEPSNQLINKTIKKVLGERDNYKKQIVELSFYKN
jgi:hypothetical protein